MGRKIKVILQPIKFRKHMHVAILCLNYLEVDEVVREFEEAEWSTGYRFWHVPLKGDTIKKLSSSLKNVATVDASAFKNIHVTEEGIQTAKKKNKIEKLTQEQLEKLKKIEEVFLDNGYSNGTAKVYCSLLKVFFSWFKDRDEKEITKDEINSFLDEYAGEHSLTVNYRKLMYNAIIRYYRFTGRPDF
jgi:integrase/recombinase XerD